MTIKEQIKQLEDITLRGGKIDTISYKDVDGVIRKYSHLNNLRQKEQEDIERSKPIVDAYHRRKRMLAKQSEFMMTMNNILQGGNI